MKSRGVVKVQQNSEFAEYFIEGPKVAKTSNYQVVRGFPYTICNEPVLNDL